MMVILIFEGDKQNTVMIKRWRLKEETTYRMVIMDTFKEATLEQSPKEQEVTLRRILLIKNLEPIKALLFPLLQNDQCLNSNVSVLRLWYKSFQEYNTSEGPCIQVCSLEACNVPLYHWCNFEGYWVLPLGPNIPWHLWIQEVSHCWLWDYTICHLSIPGSGFQHCLGNLFQKLKKIHIEESKSMPCLNGKNLRSLFFFWPLYWLLSGIWM